MVLIATWMKTARIIILARQTGCKVHLTTLILRDGTYFCFHERHEINLFLTSSLQERFISGRKFRSNFVDAIDPS